MKQKTSTPPKIQKLPGELLDRWMPLQSDIVNMVELWKFGEKYQLIHLLKNGSKYVQQVTPTADLKCLTLPKASNGEHYRINNRGDLEAWDEDGRVNQSLRLYFRC
ncbi:MAG: hypothetical protein KDA77_16570 [Planctomycetaceae bacterium]|nr:hypothetical protein [Planctomycetaceae bacterium]